MHFLPWELWICRGKHPQAPCAVLVPCPELYWLLYPFPFRFEFILPELWALFPFSLRSRNVASEHPVSFIVTSVQNLCLCCHPLVIPSIPASLNEALRSLAPPFLLLSSSTPALLFAVSISQVSHSVIIVTTFARGAVSGEIGRHCAGSVMRHVLQEKSFGCCDYFN